MPDRFLRIAARPLEILVGLVFLLAAVLKAQSASLFVAQIFQYHVFEALPLLKAVALCTLAIETYLGAALVLGLPYRTITHGLVQFMLIFFAGLIAYAWAFQGLKDCGCFGKVKIPPYQGIIKNVILIILDGAAWYGLTHYTEIKTMSMQQTILRTIAAATLALAAVLYAAPQLAVQADSTPPAKDDTAKKNDKGDPVTPPSPVVKPDDRPFAKYTITSETGETYNLAKGAYLVAMLSMTCDHCKASVPGLNTLFHAQPDIPPLVALGWEPAKGDYDEFKLETHPEFPLHNIGSNFLELAALIGHEPPRLSLIKDGKALHSWDWEDKPPTLDEVKAVTKDQPTK